MFFQKIVVAPHERAIVSRDGQPIRYLEPGVHQLWRWGGEFTVERLNVDEGFVAHTPEREAILPPEAVAPLVVPAEHRGVVFIDGVARAMLPPGRYLLWRVRAPVEAVVLSVRSDADIPPAAVPVIPAHQRTLAAIGDEARGLMLRHGRLVRLLGPGEHHLWNADQGLTVRLTTQAVEPATPAVEALLTPQDAEIVEIAADELGLHRVDGVPHGVLLPGRYILWRHHRRQQVRRLSIAERSVAAPDDFHALLPASHVLALVVAPYEQALLYVDGALASVLGAGRYLVSRHGASVRHVVVDLREQQLAITGQEVMSADKVSLRININLAYRVTDARRSQESAQSLHDTLYTAVQMAARRFIAGVTVDRLLEARLEARDAMEADLNRQAEGWGVQVVSLDLKDIILPGEMKAIFNQVIEAEKRAAANVITRREETAATRSLANTARMLESNPTLLRLKELEALKEIAERVGEVTVVAAPEQLLGRLSLSRPT